MQITKIYIGKITSWLLVASEKRKTHNNTPKMVGCGEENIEEWQRNANAQHLHVEGERW